MSEILAGVGVALASIALLGFLIYWRRIVYEHGIWDGAFNQSLPHVQVAMIRYDAHRAVRIWEENDIPVSDEAKVAWDRRVS